MKRPAWESLLLGCGLAVQSHAQPACNLHPIALPAGALTGAGPGLVLPDLWEGTQPGQFGWLTWGGSPSEPTLVRSLSPPGDSHTYVNPDDPRDRVLSVGDWVTARPGVSNSKQVRAALEALKQTDLVLPVWDQTRQTGRRGGEDDDPGDEANDGSDSNKRYAYRVSAFARVRLLDYQLPGQNRLTVRFLGYVPCAAVNQPPLVNAGPDLTITLPAVALLLGSVTDDGLPVGETLTTEWSYVSGPGAEHVTFTDPQAPVTTARFTAPGVYVLRLSAHDGALAASDEVLVAVNRANQPPHAFDQTVETDEDTPVPITLQGADPDGDPLTFEVVSQPPYGTLSGTPPELLFTPLPDWHGTLQFTFKTRDGELSSPEGTVSLVVHPVNDAPVADPLSVTGAEDEILTLLLSGADVEGSPLTFTLLSLPLHGVLWPGPNDFTWHYAPRTNFHGLDHFTFRVHDGELESVPALVSLTITNVNDAPEVEAGPDQIISLPVLTVTLAGVVEDDFFLDAPVTLWTKVSGPGDVTFGDAGAPVTTATFGAPGVYVLRLSADDGFFIGSDELTVFVNAPPAVQAGPSLTVTLPEAVSLHGVVTDDGLPVDGVLTVLWEQVAGPGTVIFGEPTSAVTSATFSDSGRYRLRLSAGDGLVTATDEVSVLVNRAPLVHAGADQLLTNLFTTLAASVHDDGLPANQLHLAWEQVSGPGEATFATNALETSVTFSAPGTYHLRLRADDTAAASSAEVAIHINTPPLVRAGADQRIVLGSAVPLTATVTDDGLPPGGKLALYWQVLSGPGVAIFDDANAAHTRVAFNAPGTYLLRLLADDSQLTGSDELTITVLPPNAPPTVWAGPGQVVNFPSGVDLAGRVTDDGFPEGGTLTVSWSKVAGPGTVTFGAPNQTGTRAEFDAPGTYVLALTAHDSELSATDSVAIVVNEPPRVSAGPDQNTTVSNLLTLRGLLSDDGLPTGVLQVAWTKADGPGPVFFTRPDAVETGVRFKTVGEYVLRLSATDSSAVTSDEVLISVRPEGVNLPPVVSAGSNQVVALTNAASLEGSVTDDGLPYGIRLALAWRKISGPGDVTFADRDAPVTTAAFSASGTYVLQLSADDSEFVRSAEVTLSIYLENQPPVVQAGEDQTVSRGPVTLSGMVWDDGFPAPGTLTFHWQKISGPGATAIEQPHRASTSVTFSEPGVYVFRLTSSDGALSAGDEVTITVTGNQPPQVQAGPDQVIDLIVATGAAAQSTILYPPQSEGWRSAPSQPGLSGLYGNVCCVPGVRRGGLAWSDSDLYVGGGFRYANGVEVQSITRWDGCAYHPLYDPRPVSQSNTNPIGFISSGSAVSPITARDQQVFVCGGFLKDLDGDGHLDFTARWNGSNWLSWRFTIASSSVSGRTMASDAEAVYFGGQFKFQTSNVPSAPVSHAIAKWDGTNWVALGKGVKDIRDDDSRTSVKFALVSAIALSPEGHVYVGGSFVTQTATGLATNLARWTGDQWEVVDNRLSGCTGSSCRTEILALAFDPEGRLLVGGNFSQAAGSAVNHIARWDGANWSALGSGFNSRVEALTVRGQEIFASGNFTSSGTSNVSRVARYDGTNWSGLSSGVNSIVVALATTPTGVYLGGEFTTAGGQVANGMAQWGVNPTATVSGPGPLSVQAPDPAGASATVTLEIRHPCGAPLGLTWNVDGGAPEYTNLVSATSGSVSTSFTNFYAPGVHTLVVTIADGKIGPISFSTTVTVLTPATAQLQGSVTDDGLPAPATLTALWQELSGSPHVSFANATSPQTTVGFTALGTYVLRLTGDDSELQSSDEVTITVRAAGHENRPPTVDAGPNQHITLADSAALQATVLDDGLPGGELRLAWSKLDGPGHARFEPFTSAATVATFDAAGSYLLRFTADDGEFVSFGDVTVHVSAVTNQPPLVQAGPGQATIVHQSTRLQGSVTDDGLPFGTLTYAWEQHSGPGTVLFRVRNGVTYALFGEPGEYVLRLSANDGRLTAFDELTIAVHTPSEVPQVAISSPLDAAVVTAPTAILGTADSPILASWTLQYRLAPPASDLGALTSARDWTTLAVGTTSISSNTLATFDPTLLLNGIYEIQLTATDRVGRTATTEPLTVIVDRNLKVGHFTLSFNDLTIPAAGLPIQVIRTYDSRDKRVGDFGVGWSLDLKNIRLQKNRHLGLHWEQTRSGAAFPGYLLQARRDRVVTLTFPDGRMHKFKASASPETQFGVPITGPRLVYQPLANTRGSLVSLATDQDQVLVSGSVPGLVDLFEYDFTPYNPSLFQYTSEEGDVFVIDEIQGLKSLTDRNGNTLLLSTHGITWTNTLTGGPDLSVTFQRDSLGRITNLVDALGHALTYRYDTHGNLVAFTDRAGNTNGFTYDGHHRLLTLADARGVEALRNEYDAGGRILRQFDAHGRPIAYAHDLAHRLEIRTNRLGFVTLYEYDERGNVVRTVAPDGGVTTMSYDTNDNLLTTVDPLGRTHRFTYDVRDNLTSATDPLGQTTRFSYNQLRHLTSVTDPRGHTRSHRYDARGNLLSMQDPLGRITSFAYSPNGLLLALTNALGHVTQYAYDSLGRLTNQVDALGHATAYLRDAHGNLIAQTTTRTRPDHSLETLTVSMQYDRLGRLTHTVFPDGSSAQTIYNAIGRPALTIDPLGRQTFMDYDPLGRLTRTTYPDGHSDATAYDAEDRPTAFTNRLGQVTSYDYDAMGRLVRTVFADGATTTHYFDLAGQWVATTDARGFSTWFGYDDTGRNVAVTNALLQVSRSVYDAAGNLTAAIDALGRTHHFLYDALNRRTNTVFADGTAASTLFDALGRRIAETDPNSHTTWFTYDARGRLRFVTNALGQATEYRYNEVGQQTHQIDANRHATTFDHDPLGRRIRRRLPGGQFETYGYNAAGLLTGRRDFNGRFTEYHYDLMNRLEQKIPDPATGEPAVRFASNALGLRTNRVDASGHTRYTYDVRNRLVEQVKTWAVVGLGVALHYAYDAAGNLTQITSSSPNGTAVAYEYDTLGRLSAVQDARLGRTGYAYDAVGNLRGCALPNGVASAYSYDALNRLTNLTAAASGVGIAQYIYKLDPAGQRLNAAETVVLDAQPTTLHRSFSYDATDRLLGETIAESTGALPVPTSAALAYTYDDVGNRLARLTSGFPPGTLDHQSFAYDPNDRLHTDAYDANGNTLFAPGFGQTQPDRYDFENRLIERRSSLHAQPTTLDLSYDGDGRRVRKTVNGLTSFYLVDDLNPTGYAQVLEELAVVGAQLVPFRLYTYGHDLLSQDQWRDGGQDGWSWSASFHGSDGHGSVRYLTDATGSVTDRYDYDAFGNLHAQSGSTPNLYLYAGEQFDPDLGLYYLRARYHHPQTGRFWTLDPFEGFREDPASLHQYTYAANNPANRADPSGLFTLAEARVTTAIASTLHATAVQAGMQTVLRAQADLARAGVGTAEFQEAVEILLWYRLGSDLYAGLTLGRLGSSVLPATGNVLGAKALWAMDRLRQWSPRQWLHLKLFGPKPLAHQAAQVEDLVTGTAAAESGSLLPARYDPVFALEQGANPATVVPNIYTVVRGGQGALPPPGTVFSGSMGSTLQPAAAGVPHGTIRATTAGAIRGQGGSVTLAPELTRGGTLNPIHVNIVEGAQPTAFGPQISNPVPRTGRIQ